MDECFLKRYHSGLILAVIGRDLNDQMLPRSFAIVEGKNQGLLEFVVGTSNK